MAPSNISASKVKKARTGRLSKANDGGSWTSTTASRSPSSPASSRKRRNGARARRSRASWLIARGSLAAKRKSGGVCAAQRRHTSGRWLRWNDELISAQRSPRA
jgi:hypothetical protein